jgi:hypothetical protein
MIRNKVYGRIFVLIDETFETEVHYVVNVIARTVETNGPAEVFLLTCEVVEFENAGTH